MKEYKRLRKNLGILENHNIFKIPVKTLTNNEKIEFVLIQEIIADCRKLLKKIENGTLIELPCKVGDIVWSVDCEYNDDGILVYFVHDTPFMLENYRSWGKYFFLKKAEAEAKLKELQEKDNDR